MAILFLSNTMWTKVRELCKCIERRSKTKQLASECKLWPKGLCICAYRNNRWEIFHDRICVTRWYIPRELLFNYSEYTTTIDIWVVGKDYVHQLVLITEVMPSPLHLVQNKMSIPCYHLILIQSMVLSFSFMYVK